MEQLCDEKTEQLSDCFNLADGDTEAESSFQSMMSQTVAQEPFSTRAAALFLLKAKEKHRISQLALDGLVGDFSEILDSILVYQQMNAFKLLIAIQKLYQRLNKFSIVTGIHF